MTCRKTGTEALILARRRVQRQADPAHLFRIRLDWCLHASPCRRLCERLVKAPGKLAWCVDAETGDKIDLYAALADPGFACPAGSF